MIDNDLALSDLIDRVETKHKDCRMCAGTGKCFDDVDQVGEPEFETPCPDCGDERYLLNAILIMEREIETQRLSTFDRFVMAALTGIIALPATFASNEDGPYMQRDVALAFRIAQEAMKQRDKADDPPDLERTVRHPRQAD